MLVYWWSPLRGGIFSSIAAGQPCRLRARSTKQFTKLLAALPKLDGRTTDADRAKLKSLAILMRMTGLAPKYAVCCERAVFDVMPNGKYGKYLRRAKTGKPVHNDLSAETMAAVLTGANPRGKHLFIDSLPTKENELKNAIEYFGGRFVKLGELADIRDEHGEKIKVGSHGFGQPLVRADVLERRHAGPRYRHANRRFRADRRAALQRAMGVISEIICHGDGAETTILAV
jgi:hypothetical protein